MRTPQESHKIAMKLARQILSNGTDARTNIETAAALIGHVLVEERSLLRSEIIIACAELAEEQYSHPDWDRPLYSAASCGKWIGTCIRSRLTGARVTNAPWKPKIKRTKKPKEQESQEPENEPAA
jgi:hypothetical protein